MTTRTTTQPRASRTLALIASLALGVSAVLYYSSTVETPVPFDPRVAEMTPTLTTDMCVTPPLLTHHIAPGSTVQYRYVQAWPADLPPCVDRAFAVWNTALADVGIRFERTDQITPVVPRVNVIATALTPPTGGAITGVQTRADGAVQGAGLIVSTHPAVVSSCLGAYKVALHEVGHLLGLGHPTDTTGASVMQQMAGRDDVGDALPLMPTACDVVQVHAALRRSGTLPQTHVAQD